MSESPRVSVVGRSCNDLTGESNLASCAISSISSFGAKRGGAAGLASVLPRPLEDGLGVVVAMTSSEWRLRSEDLPSLASAPSAEWPLLPVWPLSSGAVGVVGTPTVAPTAPSTTAVSIAFESSGVSTADAAEVQAPREPSVFAKFGVYTEHGVSVFYMKDGTVASAEELAATDEEIERLDMAAEDADVTLESDVGGCEVISA